MTEKSDSINEAIEELNKISPSFCTTKWMHSSINLNMGTTQSCYLPSPHGIPAGKLLKDPSALHNTDFKKEQRKKMLEGQRPTECQVCWTIEDLPGDNYSDRHVHSNEHWTRPFINKILSVGYKKNINPSYLEVSFSSVCNFKCSYCNLTSSTAWYQEIKKYGGYKLSGFFKYQSLWGMRLKKQLPKHEDNNPYISAFWKWWPSLKLDLMVLRITGGEPLLSKNTFRLLEDIEKNPVSRLELAINSNMGIPNTQFNHFLDRVTKIIETKSISKFIVHTSLDCYGEQAEYIRNGLNFKEFESRIELYLSSLPSASLSITCTFNALCIESFIPFLEWVISLRKRYANVNRDINLDIPHLQLPHHQSCLVLTPDFIPEVENILTFMKKYQNAIDGIKSIEIVKMERILSWMRANITASDDHDIHRLSHQKDFYLFFKEHDRRRGTDFVKIFPKMKKFYKHCEEIKINR